LTLGGSAGAEAVEGCGLCSDGWTYVGLLLL
jgi:hypothetical protein